jgi:hypothetical protein
MIFLHIWWFRVGAHRKLACSYYIDDNNKTFTLINGGKDFFFIATRGFWRHQLKNNIMDFLKGKAKIDVALPVLLCEKVYDVAF